MSIPDNSNDPVDIKELNEIMADDMELIQECFSEFIQDWPGAYVEIKSAILEKNAQKLNESAHKLKGTLKYLAAEPAANAAYSLEAAGKEKDMADIDNKLLNLKDKCQSLIDYINNFNQ
ncbi:MAG: Hpt domain-containing protein [Desulfobacteraceae bacterium]|nr:Hpt domain-containing protein [Desulfobacteraceae bacterium]